MCGIIGIVGKEEAAGRILDGLKRLEYRGYDSAGIATIDNGAISLQRREGKIANLEAQIKKTGLRGTIGIGHTRWATHGAPTANNAHPHVTENVAVVHNGIIENYAELKKELEAKGHVFKTQTDSEVIPHLIEEYLKEKKNFLQAVDKAIKRLEGAFALGIVFANQEIMVAARKGSPLVIGYGEGENYLGSDAFALAPLTNKLTYLEDGDVALLTRDSVEIYDENETKIQRNVITMIRSNTEVGKDGYQHYMLKEIFEQPRVVAETLTAYFNPLEGKIRMPKLAVDAAKVSRLIIVACGTSFYAAMVAKYWFERFAKINVHVDIASEFRYRNAPLPKDAAAVFISQSGETADTLAALRHVKANGISTLAVVNVKESTMAREADSVIPTYAGTEIGVASTKAFTAQLMALACLVIHFCEKRGTVKEEVLSHTIHTLSEVPSLMEEVLEYEGAIKEVAQQVMKAHDVIYIGRGPAYPIALEGALKLKEISYIHAEGTAAGELKHGPIALIDDSVPVIAIAPPDEVLFEKMASNIEEVAARGGKVILLSDKHGVEKLKNICEVSFAVPNANPLVAPMLYAVPVQLLAYYVAVAKGTDVDQPRNLAKSVTVE